jgi:hypothetical protein
LELIMEKALSSALGVLIIGIVIYLAVGGDPATVVSTIKTVLGGLVDIGRHLGTQVHATGGG